MKEFLHHPIFRLLALVLLVILLLTRLPGLLSTPDSTWQSPSVPTSTSLPVSTPGWWDSISTPTSQPELPRQPGD